MKTKPIFNELQIHNVPCEKLEYADDGNICIWVDDINEKRWKLTFVDMQSLKITSMDLGYNFNSNDFNKYYYVDENHVRRFRNHVLEIEDSEWIKALKLKAASNSDVFEGLNEARHFLIKFYDYEVEIIAHCVKVEKV